VNARLTATFVATLITAAAAGSLLSPATAEARRTNFACGLVSNGGNTTLGCVADDGGCWLGGMGFGPNYGCHVSLFGNGEPCCRTNINDQ
jgi:hypothetical protein